MDLELGEHVHGPVSGYQVDRTLPEGVSSEKERWGDKWSKRGKGERECDVNRKRQVRKSLHPAIPHPSRDFSVMRTNKSLVVFN